MMEQSWLPLIGLVVAVILLFLVVAKGRGRKSAAMQNAKQLRQRSVASASERPKPVSRPPRERYEEIEEATYLDDSGNETIGGDFYSEVATLLKQVLAEHPERQDLRLKLLDVYFDSGNKEGFVREALAYREASKQQDDPDWRGILEKGASLAPEHELFGQRAGTQPVVEQQETDQRRIKRFGDLPEARSALGALAESYTKLRSSTQYLSQLDLELIRTAARPSQMLHAQRLSRHVGGAQIFIKREDLTGRHPRLRTHLMGQAWIAKRLGKSRLVYAAADGQEAVLAAQSAARVGMHCSIYVSIQRGQYREAHKYQVQMMGGELLETMAGHESGDIRYAALEAWLSKPEDSYMMLNLAAGPHPYPTITSDVQAVIGRECLRQIRGSSGGFPKAIFARAGLNTDAIGFVEPFLSVADTEIHLVSTLDSEQLPDSAARGSAGDSNVYNLLFSGSQKRSAMSILEGMEYPKVEREHALLKETGRITYDTAKTNEAQMTIRLTAQNEGLIVPVETAHVLSVACQYARKYSSSDAVVVMLAEQPDKDLMQVDSE